jgi:hypothetical protein
MVFYPWMANPTSSDKDVRSRGRSLCGSGLHVNGNQKLLDTGTPISVSSIRYSIRPHCGEIFDVFTLRVALDVILEESVEFIGDAPHSVVATAVSAPGDPGGIGRWRK